jgi:hypothetical protein
LSHTGEGAMGLVGISGFVEMPLGSHTSCAVLTRVNNININKKMCFIFEIV